MTNDGGSATARKGNMIITDWNPINDYTSPEVMCHLREIRASRAALSPDRIAEIRAYDLRIAEAERWLMVLNTRATRALDVQQDERRDSIRDVVRSACEWAHQQSLSKSFEEHLVDHVAERLMPAVDIVVEPAKPSPDGIEQREVDTLLAVLRHHDEPEAHAVVARMWTALQTVQRPAPALTADEVRAVVREAMTEPAPTWPQAWCERVASRVTEKLAGRTVEPVQREAELREAFVAGYWFAENKADISEHDGWNNHDPRIEWPAPEQRDAAAAEYARSKAGQ